MVYNEGFDILIEDYSFFAFSKYDLNNNFQSDIKSRWISKCYSTLIGWFHKGDKYGCFYAEKVGENPNEITNGDLSGKLLVVENTVQIIDNNRRVATNNDIFARQSLLSVKQNNIDEIADDETSFLEAKSELKLDSEFKDHDKVVDRLNSMTNLWTATNYDQFKKMSIEELNKFAGRKKSINPNIVEEFRLKSVSNVDKSHKVKNDINLLKKLSNYHLSSKKKSFLKNSNFAT